MKLCLSSSSRFANDHWRCPLCQRQPQVIDGFRAFAPELAVGNAGFRPDYFARLAETEREHFGFRARSRLIVRLVKKYFQGIPGFSRWAAAGGS